MKNLLAIILGILSVFLLLCAIWFPVQIDWGWLKFLLTAIIVGVVAICLAASADSAKRPLSDRRVR